MKKVYIISSPISERYASEGSIGTIDETTNKIRVGGDWFDFDERWEVKSPQELWKSLGDIPVNSDDETEEKFLIFPAGTDKLDIWCWFEEIFDISVVKDLMGMK